MFKKFLLTIFALTFSLSVNAEVFKARTMQAIDTTNPPKTVELEATADTNLNGLAIEKGYLIYGDFVDLITPQPWGKNATFSVKLTSYKDLRGDEHQIKENYVIQYRQVMRPNLERSSISLMGSSDGGRTETGIALSPYDLKLMKDSKNVGDFLLKEANKDAMWSPGWELKYRPKEIIYFNY